MLLFTRTQGSRLRDEVITMTIIFVVIRPTVNFRNLTDPVTVTGMDWRSPLKCCRTPWVQCSHFATAPDAHEEVEHEQQLRKEYDGSHDADKADWGREVKELLDLYKQWNG